VTNGAGAAVGPAEACAGPLVAATTVGVLLGLAAAALGAVLGLAAAALGLGLGLALGLGLGLPGDGVAEAGAATCAAWIVVVREARQVVVEPPPLADPLHWLMVTGSAAPWVDGSTSQRTRSVAPPPLPELLHCVIVAPVVLPTGVHWTVGWVPPPWPEPLHWFTVAGEAVSFPVIVFVILTEQVTTPPPPLPEPLH